MTFAELVQAVWRIGHLQRHLNKLLSDITTTTNQNVVLRYTAGPAKAGAKVSIDLEDMHVWSVSSNTLTVERGMFGSTATTHTADAIVYVNAEATPFDVLQAANDELAALSSPSNGLFKVATPVELTWNPAVSDYNLTGVSDVIDILDIYEDANDGTGAWLKVPRDRWRLKRNSETDDFASGFALSLPFGVGGDVRAVYKTSFTPLSTLADNVATVTGLPSSALDILEMGTAIRLLVGRGVNRSSLSSQGDTRRAEEVSTTDALQGLGQLKDTYRRRIAEEAARLAAAYPG